MLDSQLLKHYIKNSDKTMYYIDKTAGKSDGWARGVARNSSPTLNTTTKILNILGYSLAVIDNHDNIIDVIEVED